MSDRLTFIDELRRELIEGDARLTRRRAKRRRAVAAGGGIVLGAVAIAAVFGLGGLDGLGGTGDADTQLQATSDAEMSDQDVSQSEEAIDPGFNTGGWETAASEIGGETRPPLFWTGEEVIIMRTENGGNDVVGERWNPSTNEASRIAESGLNWRAFAATAWTGSEVVIIGGSNGPGLNRIGAAYNPTTDSWRTLADPPGPVTADNRFGGPSAWTGEELIVWPAALAYNPTEDSWRAVTQSPLPDRVNPISVWTGDRLIVWGGCEGIQCDDSATGYRDDGFSYDPTSDTWTELPAAPLPPSADLVAAWTGTEVLITITGQTPTEAANAAAFNPDTNSWRVLSPWPQTPRRYAAAAWNGEWFVVWGGGDGGTDDGIHTGSAYDPAADQWLEVESPEGTGRSFHSMIAADDLIYISATRTKSPPLVLREVTNGSPPDAKETATEPQVLSQPIRTDGGAAIYDIPLSTGERLRLTVPAAFADELVLTEGQGPDPITIAGNAGLAAISFEPCTPQESDLGAGAPALVRCGPDQLLTLTVERAPGLTLSEIEQFELQAISSGFRYGPILVSAHPELRGCGNCSPWGPLVYTDRNIVINRTTPSTAVALDLDSLEEVWRTPSQETPFALVALQDGILLDLEAGPLLKLDLDGQERWRIDRDPDEDRLIVADRTLLSSYTGTDDNRAPILRRVDLGTGNVDWVSAGRVGADWQLASPVSLDGALIIADVLDPGMTGPAATLRAYAVDTGDTLWATTLATNSRATDGITVEWFEFDQGRALVVGTGDGIVSRIDATTGRVLWQTLVPEGEFTGTELAGDGSLALDLTSPNTQTLLHPDTGAVLAHTDAGQGFSCPVTIPPNTGFTPPDPWPTNPSDDETIWFGTAELWTPLRAQGHEPRKSVWWSANFEGGSLEGQPEIEVIYRRLDPDDDSTVVFEAPGTNATAEDGSFMINGLEPDDPGCWQATATYKGSSLSYVYEVG